MDSHIIKQSLVNNLSGTYSSGYVIVDMLFTILVSALVGFVISNLSKAPKILKLIGELCKKKEYTIIIEDKSYLTKDGSGWVHNESVYGENVKLIKAIYSYLKEKSEYEQIAGNVVLDSEITDASKNIFSKEKNRKILFKPSEDIVLNGKFKDIILQPYENTDINGENINQTVKITVKSIRGVGYINEFIAYCYDTYVEREYGHLRDVEKRYFLLPFYSGRSVLFDRISVKYNTTFDNLFFPEKQRLISTLDKFLRGELHKSKLIMLLYGEPGCGKSSIIKALSEYTGRHVQYIKIGEIKTFQDAINIFFNENITYCDSSRHWKSEKIPIKDRILVFEDLDVENSIVHNRDIKLDQVKDKRKNRNRSTTSDILDLIEAEAYPPQVEDKEQLTLSDVLQLFDGLIETEDLMAVMTTNQIDSLDPALLRPGRVTTRLCLGKMKQPYAFDMIKSYYPDEEDIVKIFSPILNDDTITPAQLENFCNEGDSVEHLLKLLVDFFSKES
jgi:energy-coupling factor transporter ATP-binding protein EcfA2